MTLEGIGIIIAKLAARFERQGQRRMLARLQELVDSGRYDVIIRWAAALRIQAAAAAWAVHSSWLDIPPKPYTKRLERIAQRSLAWGSLVADRFVATLVKDEPKINPRLWLKLTVLAGVKQGWTDGASEAAEEADAGFKTWVRVFPVRQPRDWHDALEGKTVPRKMLFTLPFGPNAGAKVEAPHDWDRLPDPAEWINCGHGVIYTPHARRADLLRG